MTERLITGSLVIGFFLALIQFLANLGGATPSVAAGLAIGLLAFFLPRFFELPSAIAWLPIPIAAASSAVGVLLTMAGSSSARPVLWAAPLAAMAVSSICVSITLSGSSKCQLCRHKLRGRLTFDCPRCRLVVCEACWEFDACRCQLCHQNKVPVFSPDPQWWERQFGARVARGRCQVCLQEASGRADLRACGNCGRLQCRPCWDGSNGQCPRCHWEVAEMPELLRKYLYRPGAANG